MMSASFMSLSILMFLPAPFKLLVLLMGSFVFFAKSEVKRVDAIEKAAIEDRAAGEAKEKNANE